MENGRVEAATPAQDIDLVFANAREAISRCQLKADVLQFVGDEVESRAIVKRMQHEARVLSLIGEIDPRRRREAEMLMGDCAKVWTGVATARPWSWR